MSPIPPLSQPIRIRLLNRQMGHHSGPVILKGHSGRAYGSISRFSPADNCHCVELTFAEYEAARADLFKAMRLHARKIWEIAVVVEEKAGVGEGAGEGETETRGNGDAISADQKRIAELEAMLEERREAMAEQGIINLKLREDLDQALQTATAPKGLPHPVAQFHLGFEDTINARKDPDNDSKGYLAGVKFCIDMMAEINAKPKGTTITLSTPPEPPVPQGTGPAPIPPLSDSPIPPIPPVAPIPITLPEVNDKTQWNPLQQIAKAEGVDLKQHKNKPALLKAITENRERLRVLAEAAARDATSKLQAA